MTRQQPESKIVNQILDALNALPQTHCRKTHGSRYSVGWPDIIGSHQGRMLAIEVKQPGKDATARQAHGMAKWRAAGALVGVAHDVEEALDIVCPTAKKGPLVRFGAGQGSRYMRAVTECDSSGRIVATYAEARAEHDDPWVRLADPVNDPA